MKTYSLRRSRRILRSAHKLFQKKGQTLVESDHRMFEADLRALDQALMSKRKEDASITAQRIESFVKQHFPKTLWDHLKEVGYALAFAIIVAFLIRQFWFELYEVPTGSMRPTIEELDRMVVSKTTFGVSVPFIMKPLFFKDDYIQRNGIIVFTVKDMDVPDADMLYFHIIPGKKRYIKRAVSKPGDTIYFYGGRIYAIDRDGNPVIELSDEEILKQHHIDKIEHIPYITFDGKTSVSMPLAYNLYGLATLKQMNEPVGKLEVLKNGAVKGEFYNGEKWVEDRVDALKASHEKPMSYSDLWGIGNFAMARLLTKDNVREFYKEVPNSDDALLYLELRHTPNLTYPKPEIRQDEHGRYHPMITPYVAIIPLKKSHLDTLQKAMITSRFCVENERAYRYQEGRRPQRREYDPKFPGVPNGCYEFYYGKGYKVHFGGIRSELSPDSPLYQLTPENIQKLFNMGTGFNIVFQPMKPNQPYNPQRFAYYRDGDLYLMGAPILKRNDPTLLRFVQDELEKQENSSREIPYIAFVDHGSPMKDGKIDVEFIRNFGLKVPEDGLVGLGDNYAMSADSRDFGFVPVKNLRGAPSFTFWPPGSRMGPLPQPSYRWITFPNLLIWSLVIIVILACWIYLRKRNQKSLF